MSKYGRTVSIEQKDNNSLNLVSDVDKEADVLIAKKLRELTPEMNFYLSEESYAERYQNGAIPISLKGQGWVVDSLDGSTNFLHQWPKFAVSIAYVVDGDPKIAVVVELPYYKVYTAIRDKGAWRNGELLELNPDNPSHQSRRRSISNSLWATYFSRNTPIDNTLLYFLMRKKSHGVKVESGAFDGGSIASGELDGAWQLDTYPWDIAGSMLILQEAGGHFGSFSGAPINLEGGGSYHVGHVRRQLEQPLIPGFIAVNQYELRHSFSLYSSLIFQLSQLHGVQQGLSAIEKVVAAF